MRSLTLQLIVSFLLVGLSATAFQNQRELLPLERPVSPPFDEGEKLVYEIFWKPLFFFPSLKAGEITFAVSASSLDERDTYRIQAWAVSDGALARVAGLEVNNYFESHIDRETFRSYRSIQKTREGKRERDLVLVFDYENNRTLVRETDPSVDPPRKIKNLVQPGIPAPVIDMLSVFYVARLQPIEAGEHYLLHLNERGDFKRVRVVAERNEEVETPIGQFESVKLKTTGGALKGGGDLRLWYSTEFPRIPVKFEADAKVGKVWGSLIQANTSSLTKGIIEVG